MLPCSFRRFAVNDLLCIFFLSHLRFKFEVVWMLNIFHKFSTFAYIRPNITISWKKYAYTRNYNNTMTTNEDDLFFVWLQIYFFITLNIFIKIVGLFSRSGIGNKILGPSSSRWSHSMAIFSCCCCCCCTNRFYCSLFRSHASQIWKSNKTVENEGKKKRTTTDLRLFTSQTWPNDRCNTVRPWTIRNSTLSISFPPLSTLFHTDTHTRGWANRPTRIHGSFKIF